MYLKGRDGFSEFLRTSNRVASFVDIVILCEFDSLLNHADKDHTADPELDSEQVSVV